jgi:hypothetical protein
MQRVLKVGVWFALAAVVGLISARSTGASTHAPKASKSAPQRPAPAR